MLVYRKYICIVVILFIEILLTGLSYSATGAPPPKEVQLSLADDNTSNPTINVFYDGSGSMEGFVRFKHYTSYMYLVKDLEVILNSKWPKSTPNYYKFGSKVIKLSERRKIISVVKPPFYEEKGILNRTYIDKVFNESGVCAKNSLNILVTDLFQTQSDVGLLLKEINKKCVTDTNAIGVAGIKSEFEGYVTDISMDEKGLLYNSENNPKHPYRPFYVVAIGSYRDVSEFFDSLVERIPAIYSKAPENKDSMKIFYPRLVNPLVSFSGNDWKFNSLNKTSGQTEGLVEKKSKFQKEVVMQLKFTNEAAAGARMTLKYNPLKYVCNLDKVQLEPKITVEKYYNGKFNNKDKEGFFNVTSRFEENNTIVMEIKLKKVLPDTGLFRISVNLEPARKSLTEQRHWWDAWNLELDSLDRWRERPSSFPGHKTVNLKTFMDSLWDMTISNKDLNIGQLYYYIDVD